MLTWQPRMGDGGAVDWVECQVGGGESLMWRVVIDLGVVCDTKSGD